MSAMASQITSLTSVYSIVYSGADQREHKSSASLAYVREIHRLPVTSPYKRPVTRQFFPFDDVIMTPMQVMYLGSRQKGEMRFTTNPNLDTHVSFTADHLHVRCGSAYSTNLCGDSSTNFPATNQISDPLVVTKLTMQVMLHQKPMTSKITFTNLVSFSSS